MFKLCLGSFSMVTVQYFSSLYSLYPTDYLLCCPDNIWYRHLLDNINHKVQHNIKGTLQVQMCLIAVRVNVSEDEFNISAVEEWNGQFLNTLGLLRYRWVPVTTEWRVLRVRMEQRPPMRHLVYVTLYRWPFGVQVWMRLRLIQTCTSKGHLYRATYTRCRIDTINP